MAISLESKTQLPLDTFFKTIQFNPLHANGVTHPTLETQQDNFDNMILQNNWQNANSSGREEVAQIIADVEGDIQEWLNFSVSPTYVATETLEYPRPRNPDLFAVWGFDVRGLWRRVPAREGFLIQGGIEQKTLAAAGVSVAYTDTDSDGYFETATIGPVAMPSFPIQMTDPNEVALYYPGQAADDHWEIRPIKVTLDSSTPPNATIVCRREQLVDAGLITGYATPTINGADNTLFLTTVDVYRHWCDPQQMCTFTWDQIWDAGQYVTQLGALTVEDTREGFFQAQPAVYDPTQMLWTLAWWQQLRMPDRITLSYKAGWPLYGGQMDRQWVRAITYMTLARLDRELEGGNAIKEFTSYWADDRGMNSTDRIMLTSKRKLDNPFGTSRGEIYAWERVLKNRLADRLELNAQV